MVAAPSHELSVGSWMPSLFLLLSVLWSREVEVVRAEEPALDCESPAGLKEELVDNLLEREIEIKAKVNSVRGEIIYKICQ